MSRLQRHQKRLIGHIRRARDIASPSIANFVRKSCNASFDRARPRERSGGQRFPSARSTVKPCLGHREPAMALGAKRIGQLGDFEFLPRFRTPRAADITERAEYTRSCNGFAREMRPSRSLYD